MLKKLTALIALFAATSMLTACGDSDDNPEPETHTAADGAQFNDADAEFATNMIQHHAQALQMVDLTMGRELDPEVQRPAESIRMAQTPEIEQMADWLTAWDQPIPETVRDHANAHGDGSMEMGSDLPGMMTAEEMAELQAAEGDEFQQLWLEMMIEHHEGAIEMAQIEQSDGKFATAIELADAIESCQQDEITTMKDLLKS